ncbi:Protein Ycf2 (chloroplast) [Olimarabidopsis pumila] [Rhizoctonia solani]|uniref:ubiquitinyl hydrolase 1 n=1 Tax=Rhizoctonia solani TaxID=456999 RepID=A0A0K6GI05_9AGAM|nr:Protein Ycf2 (chloroplast) [Olimarabidopsis pumila] [Rhizoctonia solani]
MSFFSEFILEHVAYHIFLPPKLPQEEQEESFQKLVDLALLRSTRQASKQFRGEMKLGAHYWNNIDLMLQRLSKYVEVPLEKSVLAADMKSMTAGGILSLYIKAQNAGVIIRKQANYTTFEVFEVQAQTEDVMSTPGKISRSFPGPAIQIPNSVAIKQEFIDEVANILSQMNSEVFDEATPKSHKGGNDVRESRNSTNPNYFIQFFFGFLRGMGTVVNPSRVNKRLADEVLWMNAKNPWRRSPIWLIIRVALQTSVDSTITYKQFMMYHHAFILSQCCKHHSFSTDLLYVMRVKMAKRLYKLRDNAPKVLIETAKLASKETEDLIQGRWNSVQATQAHSRTLNLSKANFDAAIIQTLPQSRDILGQVFQKRSSHTRPSGFSPDHTPRLENIVEFSQYADGGLSQAFGNNSHLALFDFEASVFNNLASWTSRQSDYSRACAIMTSCFWQYLNAAKPCYVADTADQSIRILTMMRIWMAIDELATKDSPLLSKFSPELPVDILDPLLLRKAQHIKHARLIQQYIQRRHAGASSSNPSVFSDDAIPTCFAVQYFRSSARHQKIKRDIESYAHIQENRKRQELEGRNALYISLDNEIQGMTCSYDYVDEYRRHSRWCDRCSRRKQRDNLQIEPYEWPLPPGQLDAELVVFELHRPESFTIWRDITYAFLIATPRQRRKCEQFTTLEEYDPLSPWLTIPSPTPRITIASERKSFMQSHYSSIIHIPADEHQVCVENALQFRLYDKNADTWATGPFPGITLAKYGTFRLPSESLYNHLEYAIEKTTHTSNQVLADQHDCPNKLSLHEHIAFGSLRSGARLQWMNIVRGLEEDILSFNSDEVWLLHTQAAWQIGSLSDDGSREWHQDLDDLEFGRLLVSQCTRVLGRIKANWLQAKSVLTIVTLVNRLIASLPSIEVVEAACNFLREARTVALKWLDELVVKLKQATLKEDVTTYQHRVCEMAAICRATYDIEPDYMHLLLSAPQDYAALIKASICLYDNQPPVLSNTPESLQVVLSRDRRFARQIAQNVLESVKRSRDVLSNPLRQIWPDYRRGSGGWRVLSAPNNRWITTTTAAYHGSRTQKVHLNIITGQLLIDGKPLGRLPQEYVEHPTYIRLFSRTILDVVPAKSAGMEFTTRGRVDGYQVSFALEGSKQLVIQAEKDGRLYELIPHEKLSGDFPLFFSEDYHHWAELKRKTVEFRPISSPWSDESRWLLHYDGSKTTLKHSATGSSLFDIHNASFKSLARSIGPLESDRYIHVSRSVDGLVELDLPRMKLSFFINDSHQIESHNFRDQVLDENQSAGTLFGLKNQLVLRAKHPLAQSLPRSRSVLIPDGDVSFTKQSHHVSVSVRFDSRRNVGVYRYMIDEDLRYLATDAGLTSRLFKIYLHALTSYCLPDPLTGRTGTEEALHELSQAPTLSFEQINARQAELLKAIGDISPKRVYYPAHLECMQTTHWADLPSLSQHVAFSFAVTQVLRHADTLQLFHPLDFKLEEFIATLEISDTLMKRATRQTAVYYPSDTTGFISQILGSSSVSDEVHPGRDSLAGDWEEAGQLASWASGLAYRNWGNPVFKPYNLVSLAESWGELDDLGEFDTLSYHSSWFNISLESSWITVYNLLRKASSSSNRYKLSACLASVAFGQSLPTDLIPVFVAFATNPVFRTLTPPSDDSYKLFCGYEPKRSILDKLAEAHALSIISTPAGDLTRDSNEDESDLHYRRKTFYYSNFPGHKSRFVSSLMNQWPRTNPQPSIRLYSSNAEYSQWFDTVSCLESTRDYFSSCIWNSRMKDHLGDLEKALSSRKTSVGTTFVHLDQKPVDPPVATQAPGDPWSPLSIPALIRTRRTPESTEIRLFSKLSVPDQLGDKADTARLRNLFAQLQQSSNYLTKQYACDLDKSRRDLDSKLSMSLPEKPLPESSLEKTRQRCKDNLNSSFKKLNTAFSPQNDIERIVLVSGVWPRITSRTILQQLSIQNRPQLDSFPNWRKSLVIYARVFADYQRSQRLIGLAQSNNIIEFYKELDPDGRDDLGLRDPDWLLVQIDGNFGARKVQQQVAKEMISPSSHTSTVLQLNMGEGKSSVIVPIIASSLANSSQLVRVVVLKPLWRQMFDLLVNRLSGLSNRRVYYLPFGRHIRIDSSSAQKLQNLYEKCMREGGILLAQPEHILSFKLMGIDRLISSKSPNDTEVANNLRSMQDWLKSHTRDILDESDEILHVRYQLVYTVGEQQSLDDHPDRWTTTQQLLYLAAGHIKRIQQEYPVGLSYKDRDHGRFPTIRIMPDCPAEAERILLLAVATDVRNGLLRNLSCDRLPPPVRNKLIKLLTDKELPFSEYRYLRRNCGPTIWKGLLLVRGLLASGILVFVLKHKHYRVDYGLDLSRCLLAVPYRAKDIPSLRAEFGHPDVAVVLTCLSYYYQGLTNQQLDLCFELLFKLDNPPLEYEQWVQRDSAMSDDLKQLSGVNIKDRQQFTERLVPTFSHNSATIDFFLASAVFPKEAKEFPEKLATSGWDLAERKPNITTGFSGTNDNRYLLPTSISQADPVKQLSTNALVLTYLLQPVNNFYVCMRDDQGGNLSTKGFLQLLVAQNPEVRVLLDVGAQMLELQNDELVRCWLDLRPDIEAAVYFNDRDELVVLPQNGTPALLSTSPFAQQLDKCIVYLDDGHTRGTDLNLPRETRALVTLGPKVTKDRLLQGCMRMRKLGHGQSVIFAAPPEIDAQIRSASPNPISPDGTIDALDVLRWAMLETCKDLQHHVSHWAHQGIEIARRLDTEQQYAENRDISVLQKGWTTPESRPLEVLYGMLSPKVLSKKIGLMQRAFQVPELREGLEKLGVEKLTDPSMDEEQEREVNHEVEREQQIQRPPKGEPANHSIHPDVRSFINTGSLPTDRSGILPLFYPFRSASPQICDSWSSVLFASTDFLQTITASPIDSLSEHMRPVHWIVTGSNNVRVVMSPYEVNKLLPLIRKSSVVRLHVYAPRISFAMRSFSNLQFYSIPAPPTNQSSTALSKAQLQLDLFAGQLYLPSYQDYISLCATLGIFTPSGTENDPQVEVESDGFVNPQHRDQLAQRRPEYSECQFTTTPIPSLKDLVGLRRKGMRYLLTHVGQILHARSLTMKDFEKDS